MLNQVRQYIFIDTFVQTIDVSDGQNAIVEASVKNPTQAAQFLFNLRRAGPPPAGDTTTDAGPLYGAAPRIEGVGGFNNGAAAFVQPNIPTDQPVIVVYPLKVKATGPLKYPVPVIPDPVGGGTAAAGGGPGGSGASGSAGGGGMSAPTFCHAFWRLNRARVWQLWALPRGNVARHCRAAMFADDV